MAEELKMPRHVAIILDGNGRWARAKGMPRNYGHVQGAKTVETICEVAYKMGIQYLTVYAFSTENWSRPKDEVDALMKLLRNYMKTCLKTAEKNRMCVRVLGEKSGLDEDIRTRIQELEEATRNNDGLHFQIAINYGGRDEIVRASRKLAAAAADCADKRLLYIAGGCTFVGFGAKAGAFPLHIWLPKAHPVAPAPASALLSGILTKAGIFGVLAVGCNVFLYDARWGMFVFSIGLVTMFVGALLAVCSVDLKRTLACSSMSQIGFILLGTGMQGILGEENALAVRGTLLHMVNHSLIKLALFLIAGVVVMNVHKLNLNEIRGFGRKKPFLKACFLAGALGISGIPLWNGYISKTLLHESIVEGIAHAGELSGFLRMSEWIFLVSGGMTLAYMTKLFVAVFVEENQDAAEQERFDGMKRYLSPVSAAAIGVSAAALPLLGFLPHLTSDAVADLGQGFMHLEGAVHTVAYFHAANLKGGLISIAIGILLYLALRKLTMGAGTARDAGQKAVSVYRDRWPGWLDLENLLYRPALLSVLPFVARVVCRVLDSLAEWVILLLRKTVFADRSIPHELPEGTEFTHLLGAALDRLRILKRKLLKQPAPEREVSFEHKLAVQREKILETNMIIQRSLSFGLLLFYVGLVFTLIYLLYLGNL